MANNMRLDHHTYMSLQDIPFQNHTLRKLLNSKLKNRSLAQTLKNMALCSRKWSPCIHQTQIHPLNCHLIKHESSLQEIGFHCCRVQWQHALKPLQPVVILVDLRVQLLGHEAHNRIRITFINRLGELVQSIVILIVKVILSKEA